MSGVERKCLSAFVKKLNAKINYEVIEMPYKAKSNVGFENNVILKNVAISDASYEKLSPKLKVKFQKIRPPKELKIQPVIVDEDKTKKSGK